MEKPNPITTPNRRNLKIVMFIAKNNKKKESTTLANQQLNQSGNNHCIVTNLSLCPVKRHSQNVSLLTAQKRGLVTVKVVLPDFLFRKEPFGLEGTCFASTNIDFL